MNAEPDRGAPIDATPVLVAVAGLLLVDTGAHMKGHGDVDPILERIRASWSEELRAAVLDRSFHQPLDPPVRSEYLRWAAAVRDLVGRPSAAP
jgi:hypothetical protein